MIKFVQILKVSSVSYFMRLLIPCILCLVAPLLSGCDSADGRSGAGAIAGIASISDPDPGTGNAGILVYLAGTAHQARTDQQGRYRIDGIPPGTYDLIAEKHGYQGQVIEALMVSAGSGSGTNPPVQPAEVLLQRIPPQIPDNAGSSTLGSISGMVLLEGMPDENGGVRVELNGTPFVTVSSSDGQYRLVNVPPGFYQMSFFKEGYLDQRLPGAVTVTTGGVTQVPEVAMELKQPGDPVSAGTVAEQMAATAVAPFQPEAPPGPDERRSIVGVVEVRDAANRLISDYTDVTIAINGTSYVAEIGEQGQFRFDNLTSGIYTIIGSIPDGALVQVPVDLETQRTATISVKMVAGDPAGAPGGTIRGTVILLDMDDNPLPDASGVQVAVNGTQIMATTAADGVFTLDGVPTGTHSLTATRSGFLPGSVDNVQVNAAAPTEVPEIIMTMDVERPRVIATTPGNNARDIIVGSELPVSVKFSEAMDPATLLNSVVVSPNTPATVTIGRGAAGGADDTLMIVLSNASSQQPIQFGATYRITIPATAANFSGVSMGEPYTFTFQTGRPGVVATSPANNTRDVYVDQIQNPVIIHFNTRLDPSSINERNIRVRPSSGRSVSITHSNDENTGWTSIRVATQWEPETNYTITVNRRVRASNGQTLGNTPYNLKFRTQGMDIRRVPIQTVR